MKRVSPKRYAGCCNPSRRKLRRNPDEPIVCAGCHAPWHPASGMMVGSPKRYPMCGRCWRESVQCMKWATSRKPKRGQLDFFEYAGRKNPRRKKSRRRNPGCEMRFCPGERIHDLATDTTGTIMRLSPEGRYGAYVIRVDRSRSYHPGRAVLVPEHPSLKRVSIVNPSRRKSSPRTKHACPVSINICRNPRKSSEHERAANKAIKPQRQI